MNVDDSIIGKRFASLVVLPEHITIRNARGTKTKWKCKCDCGAEGFYFRDALLKRTVPYCGVCRPSGRRNQKLYHIYHGMLQRCYNPNNPRFGQYGGRGIIVCDEWHKDYSQFEEWSIQNGYVDGMNLSIDRINKDSDYRPDNCRWITVSENASLGNMGMQKNHTKLSDVYAVSPNGETIQIDNISAFAEKYSLNYSSVMASLNGRMNSYYRGWHLHSNKSRNQ